MVSEDRHERRRASGEKELPSADVDEGMALVFEGRPPKLETLADAVRAAVGNVGWRQRNVFWSVDICLAGQRLRELDAAEGGGGGSVSPARRGMGGFED